jgi:hypothetical protein
MNLKISDFVFKIDDNDALKKFYNRQGYLTESPPDFTIHISEKDIKTDMEILGGDRFFNRATDLAIHRKIAELLPLHNAILLHSACFDVDGIGIAFAAHSGTGKTTHMQLWQHFLKNRMTVVNGDKPIIRFFDNEPDVPYAYGTPWNGKERLGCNMRTHLKHICFIERSEKNFCESIDKSAAVNLILNQVYIPKDSIAMAKTLELVDKMLSCCRLWKIKCNISPNSAEISFKTIFS